MVMGLGGLQVGNKRSEEKRDVCVMVMNAGEGRQRESAIKGMVMPPAVEKKRMEELAGASRMRWCGLKKKGRLLGTNVREVGGAGRYLCSPSATDRSQWNIPGM